MLNRILRLCLLVLIGIVPALYSQQNCPLPPSLQPTFGIENIFSDAQEIDLGDAMAEAIALHVTIIQNDELTAHLRELGKRLVQNLPPTHLNFRFYLIDLPEVNAFSIAGGRVYVSRKIVAFSRSDDEIAGILAHELGHIVTHQSAIEMTRAFREVLGVTQVGDRDDVFRKFHQYVENASRHPRRRREDGEKRQLIADQVEIFTLARGGFPPQAAVDIWDRFNELHGKAGSWLSDLFGTTTTAQHRLRDMIRNMGTLPAGCMDHPGSLDEASFKAWQEAVVDYDSATRSESLPGLISKHRLSVRLRSEITNLRFSRDGRYILAQDDAGINIASREPFTFLFYIRAPDAHEANFSPDSSSVVFFTTGMRAETWNIADHRRKSVHEITLRTPCLQSELSPDGNVLSCLNSEFALMLVDVATSSVIQEKKGFFTPSFAEALDLLFRQLTASQAGEGFESTERVNFVSMGFSPDGHYFLASHGTTSVWIYDFVNSHQSSVPGSIRDILPVSFSFLGPDRIVGVNPRSPEKSRVLRFPSGEILGEVRLWRDLELRGAAHGDFLLVGPLKDYPLGILDLTAKDSWIAIKQQAADMYDGVFVTERVNGELALHTKDGTLVGTLNLPQSNLGRLYAASASSDLNYLAASSRSHGVVWDMSRDSRAFQTLRFNAVGFDGPAAYADLPKVHALFRQTLELHMDTGDHSFHELKEDIAVQHGRYLVITKPRKKNVSNWSNADIEVRDIPTGKALWSHYFPTDLPAITSYVADATLTFRWPMSDAGARDELRHFPQLKVLAKKEDDLCEVLDANSGTALAAFVAKTGKGSLRHLRASANRNWAVIEAAGDQIIAYALPSGEDQGHFFGSHPVLSTSGLLATDSEKHEVTLYDLAKSEQRQQYIFAEPVAFKTFSGDGKRLLVLTGDQTIYLLDVANSFAPEPALASNP